MEGRKEGRREGRKEERKLLTQHNHTVGRVDSIIMFAPALFVNAQSVSGLNGDPILFCHVSSLQTLTLSQHLVLTQ
jgi:hypothetical protein